MLIVFAIALTPWSVLHHHNPLPVVEKELNCKHVTHVQAHGEHTHQGQAQQRVQPAGGGGVAVGGCRHGRSVGSGSRKEDERT